MSLDKYKVPQDSVKSFVEIFMENEKKRFEKLLGKPLKTKKDAYDNICELQLFISHPHDFIPDAENRVNEKLYYIQEIYGKEILDKGIMIYEQQKSLESFPNTMSLEERNKITQEIMNDPELAKQLNYMKYHPEEFKNLTGKYAIYLAVYFSMEKPSEREEEHTENTID